MERKLYLITGVGPKIKLTKVAPTAKPAANNFLKRSNHLGEMSANDFKEMNEVKLSAKERDDEWISADSHEYVTEIQREKHPYGYSEIHSDKTSVERINELVKEALSLPTPESIKRNKDAHKLLRELRRSYTETIINEIESKPKVSEEKRRQYEDNSVKYRLNNVTVDASSLRDFSKYVKALEEIARLDTEDKESIYWAHFIADEALGGENE